MATQKSASSKTTKSKVQVAAEKVATVAGTIVGKKNRLVKQAKLALDSAKAKLHKLTEEKKPPVEKVKKVAKKAVRKVKRKVIKRVAGLAAAGVARKVEKKVDKVKKSVKKAVKR